MENKNVNTRISVELGERLSIEKKRTGMTFSQLLDGYEKKANLYDEVKRQLNQRNDGQRKLKDENENLKYIIKDLKFIIKNLEREKNGKN